jgi:hypothetical protein
MIATGGTTGSLDGHYLHHGKRKERGGEMRYADKSERVKFSSARGLAGDPEDRGRWTL